MNIADVWLTIAVMSFLGLVRNHIVFRHRRRRLAEIHHKGMAELEARGNEITNAEIARHMRRYEVFDKTSYNSMLLDLTKWTYKQFYPEPVQ